MKVTSEMITDEQILRPQDETPPEWTETRNAIVIALARPQGRDRRALWKRDRDRKRRNAARDRFGVDQ